MAFTTISDLGDLTGKRAVVRVDLNVPLQGDKLLDGTRLLAVKDTVEALLKAGARIVLLAHFGRPKGRVVDEMSLAPVVPHLANALGRSVEFAAHGEPLSDAPIILMENTRFFPEEEKNDPDLAREFAALGDVFVNDAFSCAHRAHASTHGIAQILPSAAGETMRLELEALDQALGHPQRPVGAVVGGAKVSSKIAVLENLVRRVDHLVIGGGMANTFLAARGFDVGASLMEADFVPLAQTISIEAEKHGCQIHLPVDVVVAREFKAGAENRVAELDHVASDEMILDVGPKSVDQLVEALKSCRTIVWNGPLGAFELTPFDAGTEALAKVVGQATVDGQMISVAGGGDTVAALAQAGVKDQFTHISTAGGAFLEWMEGRELPGVQILACEPV